MLLKVTVVMVMSTAFWAYKWVFFWDPLLLILSFFLLPIDRRLAYFSGIFIVNKLGESIGFALAVSPNTANFHERSKLSSFQFVNEVIDFIWAAHEFWLRSVDCDLDFTVDTIVELSIYHNVMGSLLESVFNSDDFEFFWVFIAQSLKFLENFKYLLLLGSILAPKKIWNMKSN